MILLFNITDSCNVRNNCSPYATCEQVGDTYECRCLEGFTGDGLNCHQDSYDPAQGGYNPYDPTHGGYNPYDHLGGGYGQNPESNSIDYDPYPPYSPYENPEHRPPVSGSNA